MVALKPIVIVDLDGVVADFNTEFLRLSRKLLAKPAKGFVVTDFDYSKCGWSEAEVKRIFSYIRHVDDFWTTLERLPKTSSLAKHESDLNLFFVTSRLSTDGNPVAYQSETWLRQQFGLKAPYVIANSDKGAAANSLDADYAVDDKAENCVAIADARPECSVFIVDQPYNKQLKDKRITRVDSLNTFFKEIAK